MLLGVFVFIFAVAYMPLLSQKKYMMYSWEAGIFVASQDLKPEEARNLILKKGKGIDETYWGRNVFVIGKEYFFPSYLGPFFGKISDNGYYVNPKTREIREGDGYTYHFPLLSDHSSLEVEIVKDENMQKKDNK